jgi:hypothetical protein
MANRYWFKPKTFGYGVTPMSWEGWLSALSYCAVMLACALVVGFDVGNVLKVVACAAIFTVATIAMVRVVRAKIDVNGIGAQAPVGNDWKH